MSIIVIFATVYHMLYLVKNRLYAPVYEISRYTAIYILNIDIKIE